MADGPQIEMHENGLQFRIPPHLLPDDLVKTDGTVAKVLQRYDDMNHQLKSYYSTELILPMPVASSPLLAYLKTGLVWNWLFDFSLRSLYNLEQFITMSLQGFFTFPEATTPEVFVELYKEYNRRLTETHRVFAVDLDRIEKMDDDDAKTAAFVERLEQHTIDLIHVKETFLWTALLKPSNIPLVQVLTPNMRPSASVLPPDAEFHRHLREFFEMKVLVIRKRMGRNDLPPIGADAGPLHREYLSQTTARDYLAFEGAVEKAKLEDTE
jgi:hypothetical protein